MTDVLLTGNALDRLREVPDNHVHAVVTDPPYEIGFMGKKWDSSGIAYNVDLWRECLRVLKPGGHVLAFSATRTYHRLASAIEDAGFEVRDMISWIYGQGFPKSLDVSKAIDKAAGAEREVLTTGDPVKRMIPGAEQNSTGSWIKDNGREYVPTVTSPATAEAKEWEGWGTALKPSQEPVCMARKPLIGTVVQNVLEHRCGALNIDACRIEGESTRRTGFAEMGYHGGNTASEYVTGSEKGRWPANVIFDETAGALLDEQSGELASGSNPAVRSADKHRNVYAGWKGQQCLVHRRMDSGGASRFFYCPKASQAERGRGNNHPTVKPLDLMRYLCTLVTPPGGIILDPFCGSGTTGCAAKLGGFHWILIDLDPANIEIARQRIADCNEVLDFTEVA